MKKILYFDAFNGAAGDMIVGALLDLGVPMEHLQSELRKLNVAGYQLHLETIDREGLFARNFRVVPDTGEGAQDESGADSVEKQDVPQREPHSHEHSHQHHGDTHSHGQDDHSHSHDHVHPPDHRHPHGHGGHNGHDHTHEHSRDFSEIKQLISSSGLDPWVKKTALAIFQRLAEAESTVHRSDVETVHFHEVGSVDAIVDIVGSCIGFKFLGVEDFYASPLRLGGGTVTFSHGTWPVPAPATVELVRGFPAQLGPVDFELTTPTGAAIITTLCRPADQMEPVTFLRSGFGAGDRRLERIPNVLRLILAKTVKPQEPVSDTGSELEDIMLLEASIDDMEPELSGYFLERALDEGAYDVFLKPVQMKKNRPGLLVSVLCRPEDSKRFAQLIFQETTTLGIRVLPHSRWVADREVKEIDTRMGRLHVKIARFGGRVVNVSPEFEDLKMIAERSNLPLKQVRQNIMKEIAELEL